MGDDRECGRSNEDGIAGANSVHFPASVKSPISFNTCTGRKSVDYDRKGDMRRCPTDDRVSSLKRTSYMARDPIMRRSGLGLLLIAFWSAQGNVVRAQSDDLATEQTARDAEVDRILAKQQEAIQDAATKADPSIKDRIVLLRLRLARAFTGGVTKAEPYAQRILYLFASDEDLVTVRRCASDGRKWLEGLEGDVKALQLDVGRDDKAKILGFGREAEAMELQIRFCGAWISLYECLATPLPTNERERTTKLTGVFSLCDEVGRSVSRLRPKVLPEMAAATSLVACIAAREAGQGDKARGYRDQLLTAKPPMLRAQAMFESARASIESGNLEVGLASVKEFRERAARERVLSEVGIALLSALLESYAYDRKATVSAVEPAREMVLRVKGVRSLAECAERHVVYRPDLSAILERKFRGQDIGLLPENLRQLVAEGRRGKEDKTSKASRLDAIVRGPGHLVPAFLRGGDWRAGDRVQFFGHAAVPRTAYVVYCVDHSAPMGPASDEILHELAESIGALTEGQSFKVIFFAKGDIRENPTGGLVLATDLGKLEPIADLGDVKFLGQRSSAIPAMIVAFKGCNGLPAKPGQKVLYLLTNGELNANGPKYKGLVGNESVIAWLRDNNADKAMHVCPIVLGKKPTKAREDAMKTIALENGGTYVFVERDSD
ncbi:MAG: hypothetical protein NTV86_04100 [Planctomycetota bacterium]|nr:hypothetical protein [Planctomycetota bacterium]